ncbi:IQ calmodulin-binding motif-containing protein 1-like [Larimichthys crocea]|uniref:IQ calmodulin-binding motif-containing protein 1-like n=1 Tax=Larimichthys crocea TaxID=215358 RepID=UPI000F5E0A6F|nr:IQ calmodulin-binding motif-containing protein 1-like [Larimichthys crocea]
MEPEEEEAEEAVMELKRQLEDEDLNLEQKVSLLNHGLNKVLKLAAVQTDSRTLTRVKSQLYVSGVLSHCVLLLTRHPRMLRGNWSAAATLAQLTSSCCVGVEPGKRSEAFHRLFLPSVMDGLLSLASQLMRRAECASLFRKVMDSVGWLLRAHTRLTAQVLSSVHYEQIQMCDDVAVSLLCIQLWIQTCTASRDFLSALSDDSVLLLLNEAVGQLAVSSDSAVGGASVRLILLMASQQELRVHLLLRSFRGLDSLLDKDWRGRGFEQEVDQLIAFIRSDKSTRSQSQASTEHVRAACVIQAAWRSYQTRRRVKSLNRAVSTLQRRYRSVPVCTCLTCRSYNSFELHQDAATLGDEEDYTNVNNQIDQAFVRLLRSMWNEEDEDKRGVRIQMKERQRKGLKKIIELMDLTAVLKERLTSDSQPGVSAHSGPTRGQCTQSTFFFLSQTFFKVGEGTVTPHQSPEFKMRGLNGETQYLWDTDPSARSSVLDNLVSELMKQATLTH